MSLPLLVLRPAAQGFAAGQTQAAEALMATLHKRFPKENLTARKALQKN